MLQFPSKGANHGDIHTSSQNLFSNMEASKAKLKVNGLTACESMVEILELLGTI